MLWYNLEIPKNYYNTLWPYNLDKGGLVFEQYMFGGCDYPDYLEGLSFSIEYWDGSTWQTLGLIDSSHISNGWISRHYNGLLTPGMTIRVRAGNYVSEPIRVIDSTAMNQLIDYDGVAIVDYDDTTIIDVP